MASAMACCRDYTFAVRDDRPGAEGRLATIGKAYSGLTDREIAEMTDFFRAHTIRQVGRFHVVEPTVVVEIAFDVIHRSNRHDSGFALRFPRIFRLRPDKDASEIDTLLERRDALPPTRSRAAASASRPGRRGAAAHDPGSRARRPEDRPAARRCCRRRRPASTSTRPPSGRCRPRRRRRCARRTTGSCRLAARPSAVTRTSRSGSRRRRRCSPRCWSLTRRRSCWRPGSMAALALAAALSLPRRGGPRRLADWSAPSRSRPRRPASTSSPSPATSGCSGPSRRRRCGSTRA